MISGINPFKSQAQLNNKSRVEILKRITDTDVEILQGFSTNAASLLKGLLQRDPNDRLDVQEIKSHEFFSSINWKLLAARKIKVPFVPQVSDEADTRHIDPDFTNETPAETYQDGGSHLKTTKIDQFTYDGRDIYLNAHAH